MSLTPLLDVRYRVTEDFDIFKNRNEIKNRNSENGIDKSSTSYISNMILEQVVPASKFYDFNNTKQKCELKTGSNFEHHMFNEMFRFDAEREIFLKNNISQQSAILTADGILIDTIILFNSSQSQLKDHEKKWLIYFHGNSCCYESHLHYLERFSSDIGVNVITFNYRGVMRSHGKIQQVQDLLFDGEAVIQYLFREFNAIPQNILVYGWSLGGAIATELVALHQDLNHEMHLCNDRSFSSLSGIVKEKVNFIARDIASFVVNQNFGQIDASKMYKQIKGKKIVIYSEDDGVIPYRSSLYKDICNDHIIDKNSIIFKINLIRRSNLSDQQWGEENHCKPLWEIADIYPIFVKNIKDILSIVS